MSTQKGGASDLLNVVATMTQLIQQKKQGEVMAQQAQVGHLMNFMNLARQTTDPSKQEGLADAFEQLGAGPRPVLMQLLQATAPSNEMLAASNTNAGLRGMGSRLPEFQRDVARHTLAGAPYQNEAQKASTAAMAELLTGFRGSMGPERVAQYGEAAYSREMTGALPGDVARSRAMSLMPSERFLEGIETEMGLRLSAAQRESIAQQDRQFGASQAQNAQQFAQRMGLDWAQLDEAKKARMEDNWFRYDAATRAENQFKIMSGLDEVKLRQSLNGMEAEGVPMGQLFNMYGTAQRDYNQRSDDMSKAEKQRAQQYMGMMESMMMDAYQKWNAGRTQAPTGGR